MVSFPGGGEKQVGRAEATLFVVEAGGERDEGAVVYRGSTVPPKGILHT